MVGVPSDAQRQKRKADDFIEPASDQVSISNMQKAAAAGTSASATTAGIFSVVFQGHEGFKNSVTHYYHFFFAAMIPLIEYHLNNRSQINGYKIATDIGPMKRLLMELPLNFTEFVGADNSWSRIEASNARSHSVIALPAYDTFKDGLYGEFDMLSSKTRTKVLDFFDATMPAYIRSIPTHDIVLVERTNEEQYYRSVESKQLDQLSGAMLRSINNHASLVAALRSEFGDQAFANLILERASIYYQYHIFSHAKLVIAQHGAALSNMFFMRHPNVTIIEISPPSPNVLPQFKDGAKSHFRNLAKHLKIRLVNLEQSGIHSAVSVAALLALAKETMGALSTAPVAAAVGVETPIITSLK